MCYWRNSFMKSWQNSLKFSISQLNQNDITTKLFNPSVVWEGSLIFGEVILFSYFFLCSFYLCYFFLCKSLFSKTMHSLHVQCSSFVIVISGSNTNWTARIQFVFWKEQEEDGTQFQFVSMSRKKVLAPFHYFNIIAK